MAGALQETHAVVDAGQGELVGGVVRHQERGLLQLAHRGAAGFDGVALDQLERALVARLGLAHARGGGSGRGGGPHQEKEKREETETADQCDAFSKSRAIRRRDASPVMRAAHTRTDASMRRAAAR
jgi:hypothetical protein